MNITHRENSPNRVLLFFIAALLSIPGASSCAAQQQAVTPVTPATVTIPSGSFVFGSNRAEREYGYQLDEAAYGHSRTRTGNWYEREAERQTLTTTEFHITASPITNRQYQRFIKATGHQAPQVDPTTWKSYGLIHPYERTRRHAWNDNLPPDNRLEHPVVLVSYNDAQVYANWLSKTTGDTWRLPTEIEWVKAARGDHGSIFPWGDTFDPDKLNSHDEGPFDTVAVGSQSVENSYGLIDAAGQVFEWTQTASNAARAWVKGGSWDDKGCGVCRPAARHSRPIDLKHILIGFRLVKE